jgi:hypothetical protein
VVVLNSLLGQVLHTATSVVSEATHAVEVYWPAPQVLQAVQLASRPVPVLYSLAPHGEHTRSALAVQAVDMYSPAGQVREHAWQLPLLYCPVLHEVQKATSEVSPTPQALLKVGVAPVQSPGTVQAEHAFSVVSLLNWFARQDLHVRSKVEMQAVFRVEPAAHVVVQGTHALVLVPSLYSVAPQLTQVAMLVAERPHALVSSEPGPQVVGHTKQALMSVEDDL